MWSEWKAKLTGHFVRLVKIRRNFVDIIWPPQHRPAANDDAIIVHDEQLYAGERWTAKVETVRRQLLINRIDAMVVTALDEIAYTLNLRGNDLPYMPVFKVMLTIYKFYFW